MFRRRSRPGIKAAWLLLAVAVACLLAGLAGLEPTAGAAYSCALIAATALALGIVARVALRDAWRR